MICTKIRKKLNLIEISGRTIQDNYFMQSKFIIFLFLMSFLFLPTANASKNISENSDNKKSFVGQYTSLSLKSATELALKNNLTTLLAKAKTEQAKGKVLQSVSYLLPHVLLNLQQSRVFKENLSAMGFPSWGTIGPYNSFDGRIQLVQQIFDLSAIERFRAEQVNSKIAQLDEELAAKQVRSAVSLAYLNALSAEADLKAAKADFDLAKQLLKLGRHQNAAGLATSIDVTRFETREAEEAARYLQAIMNLHKAYIELNRVIGLPLSTRLKLTDSMDLMLGHIFSVSEGIDFANRNRTEIKIASERIHHQELKVEEAKSERLPKVGFSGDYGLGGDSPNNSLRNVGEAGVLLNMPIFDSGLIKGEVQEAESNKRQSQLTYDDLTKQVQEDVRLAFQTLIVGIKQVKAAKKTLGLAKRELDMSKDLFSAGIGDNIQVIDAQTVLARARQEYVAMLFQYNTARVNLYSALGNVEAFRLVKKKGE